MYEVCNSELPSGTILCGGKYIIDSVIGAGGFGITYAGHHSDLNKKVAIKEFFLSGHNVRNTSNNHVSLQGIEVADFNHYRQRFIDEGRTLAKLHNEAVVKVLDIFDENGTSYMVMSFVEGITLQRMVENNGPMDYEMAVNYIVQVCEALTYIHSKHILHRDVTPDNIIVTPMQKIVLIDFGSARNFVENKTQRHTTVLKRGFAPIEQYSSISRKGAFTDMYSVGAVFYYLLTGQCPLDATERTIEPMKEPIELNPAIPEQINSIIMKAIEMNSAARYQTAQELINDIFSRDFPEKRNNPEKMDMVLAQSSVSKKNLDSKKNKKNRRRMTKWIIVMAVLAIAVSLSASSFLLWHNDENKKSPQKENNKLANVNKPDYDSIHENSASCDVYDTIPKGSPKKFTIKEGSSSETFYYTGTTFNGLPNGIGTGKYSRGDYIGPYINGVREGDNCKFIEKIGEDKGNIYEGHFKNGLYNGPCKYTQTDGRVFKGYAKDGLLWNGTWTYQGKFDGRYVNGKLK
ncbi:MAG: protein kinase [Muribaculaceae bacterium]|nr:protein kinase [Muribaculaceae bacterium]